MSFRPARKKFPAAKLNADNAGELELTSHRKAIASAAAALTVTMPPKDSPLPRYPSLPLSSSPPPTDTDDISLGADTDSLQVPQGPRCLEKRPLRATSSISSDGVIDLSSYTSDAADNAPAAKRAKTSPALPSHAVLTESSILEIDDVDDPRDERLNKSEPIADLMFFFELIPARPGQVRDHAKCKTCT